MAVEIRSHIELSGTSPLEAVIAGKHYKAYLVANLAFNDGVEASAEHYGLSLADVYAAMAFYYDNAEAIQNEKEALRELGRTKLNEQDTSEVIAEIKERMKKKQENGE
jgi:uncharacterized protein (DUF433 family)